MSDITVQEAKEGLESIGMWMDARYCGRFVGAPIQTWDMPSKEKEFFTVYAMNLMLESDGFESLIRQNADDVEAFQELLRRMQANQTADFVQSTLEAMRSKPPLDGSSYTRQYYDLFERDKVW